MNIVKALIVEDERLAANGRLARLYSLCGGVSKQPSVFLPRTKCPAPASRTKPRASCVTRWDSVGALSHYQPVCRDAILWSADCLEGDRGP